MADVSYDEGDWFTIPLRNGRYATGLVARRNHKGVLVGYFYGPARQEAPDLRQLASLTPDEAVLVATFSHLGLVSGEWRILGRQDDWDRTNWPMPVFIRYEELSGRAFRVFYDDNDPNKLIREEKIVPGIAEQGPKDRLMGAGSVERTLTRLLGDATLPERR